MREMDQNYDMTIDIDWAGTEEQRVGQIPPEIGEQEFEIAKVTMGVQKQGDNVNEKFINLLCKQMSGEFPGTRSTFKFLGFGKKVNKRGTTQAGETKAFLADIGRSDLFTSPSFDPNSLIGTLFIANVAHSTNPKTNQTSVWLNQPKPCGGYMPDEENANAAAPMRMPQVAIPQVAALQNVVPVQQAPVASTPAPVVEPKPAIPRRMRPVPQG
jgi:hypothetical protein